MAKAERSQESGGPGTALTKTPSVNEISSDTEIVSSEGEFISVKTNCPHVNIAINLNSIRKAVQSNGGFTSLNCLTCKANVDGDVGKIEDLSLCMKCGEYLCTVHVLPHYEARSSELHFLYVNISDWNVKCFECKTDVSVDQATRLSESINLLKNCRNKLKFAIEISKFEPAPSSTVIEPSSSAVIAHRNSDTHPSLAVMVGTRPTYVSPRGLCNLGNTCFFNSVLQCLARTPFLVETLIEMKEPGEKVTLKLGAHDPVEVELQEKWGPVTENLVSTLRQITTQTGNAFTPAHLLEALRSKHRQFMGFNQHDAHELLRTLLDCVKNEDLRRYRVEILRHFGLSRKTNPDEVDEKKRALAKEMDKKLTEIVNIRPDQVFRGFTVSANTCIKCSHKSEIPESFLDLSLPVSFLRLQPPTMNRRRNDFGEKPKSKHQLKKERKQAKKNKKLAKMKKRYTVVEDQKSKNTEKVSTETRDVNESGYSSGKASSPVLIGSDVTANNNENNDLLAEALNEINATPLNNTVEDDGGNAHIASVEEGTNLLSCETPSSEVAITDNSSAGIDSNGAVDKLFSNYNVASTSSYDLISVEQVESDSAEKSILMKSSSNSSSECRLANSLDSSVPKLSDKKESSSSGDEDDDDPVDENDDDDNDAGDSDEEEELIEDHLPEARGLCMTLQPPITDDEENSILACLREYTKCEILTGNNKVVCEKCSNEASKNGEKKQIYRNFTKQLLVKSPPPVLILHLKRFEAKGAFSFRKVDTTISFPLTLDIGSFCSATCERLLYYDQKKILYSLYGIVEHSGSLNAGHYVAYVKVRNTSKHSYRRLFLPDGTPVQSESFSDKHLERMMNELKDEDRQWYYISDSMVRSISEEDVLRKQAYLLFYERIW